MHLYLNYPREHWMKEGENPQVGLILCAGKAQRKLTMRWTICPIRFSLLNIKWYFLMKGYLRTN